MKLGILLSYYNVAKKLIDGENALDPSVKFKLLGVMRQLETYVTDYETVKNELIMKYGEKKDENGWEIKPENENFTTWKNEVEKLLIQEIDIEPIKLKSVDVFNKGISAEDLMYIYDFIEE